MHTQALPPTAATLQQLRTAAETLDPTDLLTDAQVALMLDVSPKTLATWRSTGRYGLPFLRIGARIRYRRQDVLAWLESRRTGAAALAQGEA
ncbi:Helix-turn-helix domain-containing protein [Azotobacter beijerinckii]|uniref:Helix-turn-helix domain-containing protein n=1 Tax=Azotobacter beijerinckii TaxID=170623 RepID=A0A1H6Y904_9GAMM|nr:helix-turn-helix domain-containing protein [Azotobacter beijerinckii]SEJ33265.1 Helix-turn-helix domain-containing protein [Azotobacter beijerinckii]